MNRDEIIKEIKKQRVDIRHALQGNPWDKHYDFHGRLKPEFFFDEIHVRSKEHEKLKKDLYDTLTSHVSSDKIVFINGFPGNGKTTFLHTFKHDYKDEFNHIFVNLEDKTTVRSHNKSIDSEVLDLIKKTIRGRRDLDDISPSQTLSFFRSHKETFYERDLISDEFYDQLNSIIQTTKYSPKELKVILNEFDFRDTFTYLFVHLVLNRRGKRTIVYVDNLDVASNEYLSRQFLSSFQDAIDNAVAITRLEIFDSYDCNFIRDFRFLLCLRDANDAYVVSHKLSRLSIRQMPFRIEFSADFYKDILRRKMEFVKLLYEGGEVDQNNIDVKTIEHILNKLQDDKYFQHIFIPLYNYDYRKVIVNCLSVIVKYNVKDLNAPGIRGVFVFGIVGNLIENNFLISYFSKSANHEIGYCYEERVIITLISNLNRYYVQDQEDEKSDSIGLFNLINNLSKVISIKRSLEGIASCFLFHKRDWVNLLTILNSQVNDKNDLYEKYGELLTECIDMGKSEDRTSCKIELNQVKVRLNPSGYVYVRHILPHFEFYSHIVGNKKPLYDSPLLKCTHGFSDNNVYEFENKVDLVIQRVKLHFNSMERYFENIYETNGVSRSKFPNSDFSFRYYGDSDRNKSRGYFHSSRICSYHIGYLNDFRRYVLNNLFDDNEIGRKIDFNKRVVDRICFYLNVILNSYDKKAIHDYGRKFEACINHIVKSDYKDFTTSISKTDGSMLLKS